MGNERTAWEVYEETLARATDEQRKIINTQDGIWAVLAGPGSGKTATMTARIAQLVYNGVPPERILMLTFTVKSALEMRDRAIRLNPDCADVVSGTFHSIGLKLLRSKQFGDEFRWHVIDDTVQQEFLYHAYAILYGQYDELGTAFREVKKEYNIEPADVRRFFTAYREEHGKLTAKAFFGQDPTQQENATFKLLVSAMRSFPQYKRDHFYLELDDIVPEACRFLQEHPEFQNYFKYICVDEYQDTSSDQYTFSRLLAAGSGNLLCVGDDKQSIYGWRHANVKNFMQIVKEAGDHVLQLSKNFRSCPEVVGITNCAQNIIHEKLATKAMQAANVAPVFQSKPGIFYDIRDEAKSIAKLMVQAHAEGIPWNEMAVLFRTHKGLNSCSRSLQAECIRYHIPMRIVGSNKITEKPETKLMLAIIRLLKDRTVRGAWASLLQILPGIGEKTALSLGNQMAKAETYLEAFDVLSAYVAKKKLKPDKAEIMDECVGHIYTICANLEENAHIYIDETQELLSARTVAYLLPVIRDIFTSTHFAKRILFASKNPKDEEEYAERVSQMIQNLEYLGSIASSVEDIDAFLDTFFTERREPSAEVNEAVTLSTIHSAKGLEWDTVFVADLMQGMLPSLYALDPRKGSQAAIDEEARLFYVAISRAKKHLFLSATQHNAAPSSYSTGNNEPLQLSQFIEKLKPIMNWRFDKYDFEPVSFITDTRSEALGNDYLVQHLEQIGQQAVISIDPATGREEVHAIDAVPF